MEYPGENGAALLMLIENKVFTDSLCKSQWTKAYDPAHKADRVFLAVNPSITRNMQVDTDAKEPYNIAPYYPRFTLIFH